MGYLFTHNISLTRRLGNYNILKRVFHSCQLFSHEGTFFVANTKYYVIISIAQQKSWRKKLETLFTSSGRLKKVACLMTKQDVVRTSGKRRRIYDVLKTSDLRHLEDVQFTTSWRCLIYDVFRTSDLQRPIDVWFTSFWDVQFKTPWKRLI